MYNNVFRFIYTHIGKNKLYSLLWGSHIAIPSIQEGEATLNKFINVKCNCIQYFRYCFKGMGHNIGSFEIF